MLRGVFGLVDVLSLGNAWAGDPCQDIGGVTRPLNTTKKKNWACLRYQAQGGSPASPYFVGRRLISGNSPDEYKPAESVEMLV